MKKILYFILLLFIFSCNIKDIQDKSSLTYNEKNYTNTIKGKVDFSSFKVKALDSDIAKNATVSLIYPEDFSDVNLRNNTIATGLTDSNGNFEINLNNFPVPLNQIFILETSKRLNGIGSHNLSLRTNILWNGNSWKSITKPNLVINKNTTAISCYKYFNLINIPNPNFNITDSIDRIDLNLPENSQISFDSKLTQNEFNLILSYVQFAIKFSINPINNRFAYNGINNINMNAFQLLLEINSVNNAGLYPPNIEIIKQNSQGNINPYWINKNNPYGNTITTDYVINYDEYIQAKNTLIFRGNSISSKADLKGLVLYKTEPNPNFNNYSLKYWIYEVNLLGDLVVDSLTNQPKVLSNEF
ncbi:MAG: hypothetical protein U0457_05030 [Candidatus Sericytochromatia bacterium]